MKQLSSTPRRLAAAVAVSLALTAGTGLASSPVLAAPVALTADASAQETGPFAIGADERLISSGAAGFVTYTYADSTYTFRWHRSTGGATAVLPRVAGLASPRAAVDGERVLVQTGKTTYRILDMAGGAPVDVDTSAVGPDAGVWALMGDTLVMRKSDGPDRDSLHLLSTTGGTVTHRRVTGLPADADVQRGSLSLSGAAAFQYRGTVGGTTGERLAVVDLKQAKVVEDRAVPDFYPNSDIAVSATHLAWSEWRGGSVTLVTAARGTQEPVRRTALTSSGPAVSVHLLKDWVVYGVAEAPEGLSALSLTDGTKVTGMLHRARSFGAADEPLLAEGATTEHGWGVYEVEPGTDGRPAATVLATFGVTTPTTVLTERAPATADFRRAGARAVLRWTYGRSDVVVNLTLTHQRTGKVWTPWERLVGTDTEAVFEWDGTFDDGTAAHNGDYTWKMTVGPVNSWGADSGGKVERTGTLRVDSGIAAHDYSDSGSPDLLFRDGTGRLASYDVRQFLDRPAQPDDWEKTDRGGGWYVYDRLLSAGNLDATPYSDVVARDKAGVLWLYSGTGHSLAKPVRIGGGWGAYDKLAAGSDLTGDGRPDLVATDRSGVLWLYKATGSATKPFAPRKRIGGGWNTYDLLTAPGDLGGAKAGDLLARDTYGVLWLYLGKGDGTFAPRTRVGDGWDVFTQIVNIGDVDRDGRVDLIAESGTQRDPWLTVYKGTGNWKAPFGSGKLLGIPPYDSPYGARPVIF